MSAFLLTVQSVRSDLNKAAKCKRCLIIGILREGSWTVGVLSDLGLILGECTTVFCRREYNPSDKEYRAKFAKLGCVYKDKVLGLISAVALCVVQDDVGDSISALSNMLQSTAATWRRREPLRWQ